MSAGTHPTYADLDAQNRALHRLAGELHLVVARALDGRVLALRREADTRQALVEAEAAVDRVRAVLVAIETADPDGPVLLWPELVRDLHVALDGAPVASDGCPICCRSWDEHERTGDGGAVCPDGATP